MWPSKSPPHYGASSTDRTECPVTSSGGRSPPKQPPELGAVDVGDVRDVLVLQSVDDDNRPDQDRVAGEEGGRVGPLEERLPDGAQRGERHHDAPRWPAPGGDHAEVGT